TGGGTAHAARSPAWTTSKTRPRPPPPAGCWTASKKSGRGPSEAVLPGRVRLPADPTDRLRVVPAWAAQGGAVREPVPPAGQRAGRLPARGGAAASGHGGGRPGPCSWRPRGGCIPFAGAPSDPPASPAHPTPLHPPTPST